MKSKWKSFGDAVFSTVLILLIVIVILEIANDMVTQVKIRNKIKEPEKCITVNKKYYCEVEK